jgi:3-oxoacyl-[acyl-carrier protein] reductase
MDLGISGKTAAVAASSTGLGYASAKALIADGVKVAICGRDRARIEAAAAELGALAVPVVADVSTAAGAAGFIADAIAVLGHIDILVANGGGPPKGGLDDVDLEAYRTAFESNALASMAMVQGVLPGMRARKWGRIVAITSVVVKQPAPYLILSNTARAGLTAFLKSTASTVAADGVTVNSAMPGSHATDRIRKIYGDDPDVSAIPVGHLGDPDDFGHSVAFLCSTHAKFITGQSLVIDGGGYPALW